jgi:DNA-binding CsgD family transcriptional regulator/PAS domain-containing protein
MSGLHMQPRNRQGEPVEVCTLSAADGSGALVALAPAPNLRSESLDWLLTTPARDRATPALCGRQLAALADFAEYALGDPGLASLLDHAVAVAATLVDADVVQILRPLPDGDSCVLEADGDWDADVRTSVFDCGPGSQARFGLDADGPVAIHELATEGRFEPMRALRERGAVGGVMLRVGPRSGQHLLLGAYARRPMLVSETELDLLRALAGVIAGAIERLQLRRLADTFVSDNVDLVARLDAGLRCTYANAALALATGRRGGSHIGRSLAEIGLVAPEQLEALEAVAESVLRRGREREIDTMVSSSWGERTFRLRFVPEPGVDDTVESILVIARDLSEVGRLRDECASVRRELAELQHRQQELCRELLVEQRWRGEHQRRAGDAALIAEQLTDREVEILPLLVSGLTNQQIAARLHLSAGTVRNHLGRLFPKLDAADRTQAAVRAVELGLVGIDGA